MEKRPLDVQRRCQADAQVLQGSGQPHAVALAQTNLDIADVKIRQPASRAASKSGGLCAEASWPWRQTVGNASYPASVDEHVGTGFKKLEYFNKAWRETCCS